MCVLVAVDVVVVFEIRTVFMMFVVDLRLGILSFCSSLAPLWALPLVGNACIAVVVVVVVVIIIVV